MTPSDNTTPREITLQERMNEGWTKAAQTLPVDKQTNMDFWEAGYKAMLEENTSLQSERDQLKKLNDCLQEGVDAFKELYLKDKDERDRLKNENHALHQSEYNHLENIKQLKRALYEQQVYTAELQAKERELYNKYDAQFTELTTANKVIDQCEEALQLSERESLYLAQTEDNFQSACEPFVKEALSTIQSLKLKGK